MTEFGGFSLGICQYRTHSWIINEAFSPYLFFGKNPVALVTSHDTDKIGNLIIGASLKGCEQDPYQHRRLMYDPKLKQTTSI